MRCLPQAQFTCVYACDQKQQRQAGVKLHRADVTVLVFRWKIETVQYVGVADALLKLQMVSNQYMLLLS